MCCRSSAFLCERKCAGSSLVVRLAPKGIAFCSAYQAWYSHSVRRLNPSLHVNGWENGKEESLPLWVFDFTSMSLGRQKWWVKDQHKLYVFIHPVFWSCTVSLSHQHVLKWFWFALYLGMCFLSCTRCRTSVTVHFTKGCLLIIWYFFPPVHLCTGN